MAVASVKKAVSGSRSSSPFALSFGGFAIFPCGAFDPCPLRCLLLAGEIAALLLRRILFATSRKPKWDAHRGVEPLPHAVELFGPRPSCPVPRVPFAPIGEGGFSRGAMGAFMDATPRAPYR